MSRYSSSNIKVFPAFTETAFFSGEEFSCTLTFKNVAETSPSSSNNSLSPHENQRDTVARGMQRTGATWMVDTGRTVSEGAKYDPSRPKGLRHARSRSTVGGNGSEHSRSSSVQKSHSRSQSVAETLAPTDIAPPVIHRLVTDKSEGIS